ncbi:MAG: right-handed parallel beta-helix repeat-containing protein [Bacteroidaceae bacterium]|nr:right-handed parallel beta-helix repeat-containing protein [Bacteroidaceae bacterium]
MQSNTSLVPDDGGYISDGQFVVSTGNHIVKIMEENGAWLTVGDNTELIIDGNIILKGNAFRSCDIIKVTGRNVFIHGNGRIIGDRWTHQGKDGEWGMGIRLHGANDVTLEGLTISDCWGDCIYIGGKTERVTIDGCVLRGSRRQGISITNANCVTVSDCRIANISGTNPQYAIDIEPNKRCVVDSILIKNIIVSNCEGGIRAIIGKKEVGYARIGKVEILDCHVMANSRHTIHFAGCDQATVSDCMIETRKGEKPILSRLVGSLIEKNNKVIYK